MHSPAAGSRVFTVLLTLGVFGIAGCDLEPTAPDADPLAPADASRSSHGATPTLEYTIAWAVPGGATGSQVVTPVETAETVEDFYDYQGVPGRGPSANTGYETVDVGTLLLHRDTNTGLVSMVTLYDEVGDPDGGVATALLENVPGATSFVVLDEPGETPAAPAPGTFKILNRWIPAFGDGWAIRGGFEAPFSFDVTYHDVTGLSAFEWVDGDGSRTSVPMSDQVTFTVSAAEVVVDDTPPVIAADVAGTLGDNGWYVDDVTVSWTVTDSESAISEATGCDPSVVTTDTDGVTFTCEATSEGGTASESVTVMRDASPPAVAFSGNAGSYELDQDVTIACDVSDATSGVATSDCPGADDPAWTFGVGTTTLTGTGTDVAGNEGAGSTSFDVVATAAGICGLVEDWVANRGVARALCVKLEQADRSANRGRANAGAGQLGAFINHVNAVRGRWLTDERADLLIEFAGQL